MLFDSSCPPFVVYKGRIYPLCVYLVNAYRMLKNEVLMLHSTNNRDPTTVISLIHSMMFSMQSLRFLLCINCFCSRMDFLVRVSILLRRLRSKRFILYLLFFCVFVIVVVLSHFFFICGPTRLGFYTPMMGIDQSID